jgi:hypothetical protein
MEFSLLLLHYSLFKINNNKLHNLPFITYPLRSLIRMIKYRKIRWVSHVERMGKEKEWNLCRILVGRSKWKRPLRRPSRMLVDNIKMDLIDRVL